MQANKKYTVAVLWLKAKIIYLQLNNTRSKAVPHVLYRDYRHFKSLVCIKNLKKTSEFLAYSI